MSQQGTGLSLQRRGSSFRPRAVPLFAALTLSAAVGCASPCRPMCVTCVPGDMPLVAMPVATHTVAATPQTAHPHMLTQPVRARQPVTPAAFDFMQQGIAAEHRKDWAQARQAYQQATQQQPQHAASWHRLAVIATRQQDHAFAAQCYNTALQLAPHDAELLSDAGYACYLRQEYPAAEQLLIAALHQNPQHRRANNNLGLTLGMAGQMSSALAVFERLESRPQAYHRLGSVYLQRGDHDQAWACYQYAEQLDPQLKPPATLVARMQRAAAPQTASATAPESSATPESKAAPVSQVPAPQPSVQPRTTIKPRLQLEQITETATPVVEETFPELTAPPLTLSAPVLEVPLDHPHDNVADYPFDDTLPTMMPSVETRARSVPPRTARRPESLGWTAWSGHSRAVELRPASVARSTTTPRSTTLEAESVTLVSRSPSTSGPAVYVFNRSGEARRPAEMPQVLPGWKDAPAEQNFGMQIVAGPSSSPRPPAPQTLPSDRVQADHQLAGVADEVPNTSAASTETPRFVEPPRPIASLPPIDAPRQDDAPRLADAPRPVLPIPVRMIESEIPPSPAPLEIVVSHTTPDSTPVAIQQPAIQQPTPQEPAAVWQPTAAPQPVAVAEEEHAPPALLPWDDTQEFPLQQVPTPPAALDIPPSPLENTPNTPAAEDPTSAASPSATPAVNRSFSVDLPADQHAVTVLRVPPETQLADICLVQLTDAQTLTAASPDLSETWQEQTYYFSSEAAAASFRAHPERYVPVAGGLDVVGVRSGQRIQTGDLSHAAWYRHHLYLFTTADHLEQFRNTPTLYVPGL